MLEKEFYYYVTNQADLVKKYNNKFIVIKNEQVIGAYDSLSDAYSESIKSNELGTFLIQHCFPGKDSYSQTFHSRVLIHPEF